MRDILVTLVVLALVLRTFWRVEYGAYLWAWLSLMNPHRLAYGFAVTLPFAQMAAAATFISMLYSRDRKPLPVNGGVVALILLWIWMSITSILSINPSELVWERWIFVFKINLMLLVTLMLLRGREQIDRLIWVVVLSVGFFGIKGGIFTIATGGSYRVWGPVGSMLEENNALAVGLIMTLPFFYYLREMAAKRWAKLLLLLAMVLIGASVLGSQSRGALLAMTAMLFFLGLKSRYPVRFSLLLGVAFVVGIALMPESWSERMATIQDHEDEGSAMSRIYTWMTLWNVAVDRPIIGAGFRADTVELFARYAPTDERFAGFLGHSWVAHSIYFQALGEHGFVGLLLFVAIWVWVWIACARLARQAAALDGLKSWAPLLLRMCQVSTIGYCVGGAFLSLMTLDLAYYILILVTLVKCEVDAAMKASRQSTGVAPGTDRASVVASDMPGTPVLPPAPMDRP